MKYEFKGTKGEWKYVEGDDNVGMRDTVLGSVMVLPDEYYVCRVWGDLTDDKKEETANAHLIAAAPELLQACIEALRWLPSLDALPRNTETEAGNATKQVLAAIHKALNITD